MRKATVTTTTLVGSILGFAFLASPAIAQTIEADLQTGRRWAATETDGEVHGKQLNEVAFAARYNILGSGLSVGPSFVYASQRDVDLEGNTKAGHYELGVEAKYGIPLTSWMTPYAKARYVAYSKGTVDVDENGSKAELNYRTYGTQLGLGAAFGVTKNIQLTAEAGYGIQMIRMTGGKAKSYTEDGVVTLVPDSEAIIAGEARDDFNSKSFLVGLNVNI